MRIAYVGNFEPEWSTENDVRLALEAMGHDVIQCQENRIKPRMLRHFACESDLLLWTSTWDEAQPLPETLDTLHELGRRGIPSAAYHLDTFWQTARDRRRWWRNPMWRLGHVFTADGDWQREFELSGIRHHWLPAGIRHTAAVDGTHRTKYACDVAFVGSDGRGYHSEWPYRQQLILELEAMCARNGWTWRNPGGRQEKVDREHMADFYASAKVTVGDSLCTKREVSSYWSDRVYETTGRNGLLIMPDLPLLNSSGQFDGELPTYPWDDFKTLERMIGGLLELDDTRTFHAKRCAEITRERHTYVNRMQSILEVVS